MAVPLALSQQTFVVKIGDEAGPTTSVLSSYRFAKRIHLAVEVLKAAKLCAGDPLMVKPALRSEDISKLSTSDDVSQVSNMGADRKTPVDKWLFVLAFHITKDVTIPSFTIGVAWPSPNLDKDGTSHPVSYMSVRILSDTGRFAV